MQLKIFLLVVLFSALLKESYGLKCYTCSATENDANTLCEDDVSMGKIAITDCDKIYCTISRIEYLDPKGKLSSISRSCQDKVAANGVTEDSTFRTYERSCKTDLCNFGSGKGYTTSGIVSLGDKSTIIVPGTGRSSGTTIGGSVFRLILALVMILRV